MTDDILARLAAANPVPDPTLSDADQARADAALATILGDAAPVTDLAARRNSKRRAPWFAAAAAVTALALGSVTMLNLNNSTPVATAAEVLTQAADASAHAPQPGVTDREYLKRTDTLGDSTVVTQYEYALGHVSTESRAQGPSRPELADAARLTITPQVLAAATTASDLQKLAVDTYGDVVRGGLQLLLHPALSSAQQREIFTLLATAAEQSDSGITLAEPANPDTADPGSTGTDDTRAATFTAGDLTFTLLPSTGQLTSVTGLVAPGVVTTVDATAILNCVSVTGLDGPADVSLACADENYLLKDLSWDKWGADTATATGTAVINDCDPFCAEGTFHEYPVTVTIREPETCGYNAKIYSRLDVAFAGTEPNPNADPAAGFQPQDESFDIGCTH